MADAVKSTHLLRLSIAQTADQSLDAVTTNPTFDNNFADVTATINGTSAAPATKAYTDTIALAAGVATIDLQSLLGPGGAALTFAGLKVQQIRITCPTGNTAGITFDVGATNGYNLFGEDNVSNESVEVLPGCAAQFFQNDKLEDVDATHKDIDVTGTGTEGFNIELVAG